MVVQSLISWFPIQLWAKSIFVVLGNNFGKFVFVDDNMNHVIEKHMSSVMVELDVSRGLPAELDILCGDKIFFHMLDNLKIPFHCHFCWNTGHLKDKCP